MQLLACKYLKLAIYQFYQSHSDNLAPMCVKLLSPCVSGYCGADIKALCTEAALAALRRRYPQIYASSQRYQLDVGSIVLGPQDFGRALRSIVPAGQRAAAPPGQALSCVLKPLLQPTLVQTLACLMRVFPHAELLHREHTHGTPSISC